MRRDTAVRNLRKVADIVQRWSTFGDELPVVELWTYGELVEPFVGDLEVAQAVLVVDLPAEELTWQALPLAVVGFASASGLEKLAVARTYRPAVWPVWNHAIHRPVRIWNGSGIEEDAFSALATGTGIDEHRLAEPAPDAYRRQLVTELSASLAHLKRVTDRFPEREWRREHKGFGTYPEDHLWRAAQGYLELRDALQELGD